MKKKRKYVKKDKGYWAKAPTKLSTSSDKLQKSGLTKSDESKAASRIPYESGENFAKRMEGVNLEQSLKKFNEMADALPMSSHPRPFPENPHTLSVIQEALLSLTGTDVLTLSFRLGAKSDIRATIKWIQEMYPDAPTLIQTLIPDYPLDLIIAYAERS